MHAGVHAHAHTHIHTPGTYTEMLIVVISLFFEIMSVKATYFSNDRKIHQKWDMGSCFLWEIFKQSL